MAKLKAAVVFLMWNLRQCFGELSFPSYIPNSDKIIHGDVLWTAVGHKNPLNGNRGNLNAFGMDVFSNRIGGVPNWEALCDLDSDGDGVTNKVELGDPDCQWRSSDDNGILLTEGITHPGFGPDDFFDTNSDPPRAFVAHATLMCLAWLVIAPIGILSATCFKKSASEKFYARHWFKIHKLCVGTAVYFSLMAYVTMVNDVGEFLLDNTHTRIGTAVVILCFIQPLSGFYRFHLPKSPEAQKPIFRVIWEYVHQWTGRVTVILAVTAIYYGFELAEDEFGYIKEDVSEALKMTAIVLLILGGVGSILYVFLFRGDYPFIADMGKTTHGATNGGKHTNGSNGFQAGKDLSDPNKGVILG